MVFVLYDEAHVGFDRSPLIWHPQVQYLMLQVELDSSRWLLKRIRMTRELCARCSWLPSSLQADCTGADDERTFYIFPVDITVGFATVLDVLERRAFCVVGMIFEGQVRLPLLDLVDARR